MHIHACPCTSILSIHIHLFRFVFFHICSHPYADPYPCPCPYPYPYPSLHIHPPMPTIRFCSLRFEIDLLANAFSKNYKKKKLNGPRGPLSFPFCNFWKMHLPTSIHIYPRISMHIHTCPSTHIHACPSLSILINERVLREIECLSSAVPGNRSSAMVPPSLPPMAMVPYHKGMGGGEGVGANKRAKCPKLKKQSTQIIPA